MKLSRTNDNSHTVISSIWNEAYHSRFGAWTESQYVFIKYGLLQVLNIDRTTRVFEMGFGTGLNAYLTALHASKFSSPIHYSTVELFPLEEELWKNLNYAEFGDYKSASLFNNIHASDWEIEIPVSEYFTIYKMKGKIEEIELKPESFDLIYFDAFAPNAQPELWEIPIFQKMIDALMPGGLLTTYCAKGQVKRNMKAVGFDVETVPGPPGKREMTLARKS